jgi:hypothetical protein
MTCRHAVSHHQWRHHMSVWCSRCRDYISLGPANDDSDSVRIEIRAAELAALGDAIKEHETTMEWAGRIYFGHNESEPIRSFGGNAGWLARVIASHDKEQGNG